MRGELFLPTSTLLGFLLTLARVAGVFVFVPLPGLNRGMDLARIIMAVSVTIVLAPYWPHPAGEASLGLLAVWMMAEAALGIGIGLAVAFVAEAVSVGAQMIGLQAGYAFASTIDPNSQADSNVLVVFSQLSVGLLFFTMGLDREVIKTFAVSLTAMPAGSFVPARGGAIHLVEMAQIMFTTGVRLALPVIGALAMVDISLALLGRVNAQLQLLSLAMPIKMLLGLVILGWLLALFPTILRGDFDLGLSAARALLTR
jgi:flagellar biosynthetic protein FliR